MHLSFVEFFIVYLIIFAWFMKVLCSGCHNEYEYYMNVIKEKEKRKNRETNKQENKCILMWELYFQNYGDSEVLDVFNY